MPMPDPQAPARMRGSMAALPTGGFGAWFRPGRAPSALGDLQPVPMSGGLLAIGRARLDDLADLARSLELGPEHGHGATPDDLTVIAGAYRRWGPQCVDRFDGDFAFAIHDGTNGTVFCARDRFGVVPFQYAHLNDGFAVSDRIRPLLNLRGGKGRVSERRIVDYLVGLPQSSGETFYEGIHTLPPGHVLRWKNGDLQRSRYHGFELGAEADGHAIAHAGDAVREYLGRSTRERMRPRSASARCGTMLSGGLDSSSVTALAAEGASAPVPTFSLLYSDMPELDESRYIGAVLATGSFDPHFVEAGGTDLFADPDLTLLQQEQPFAGYGTAKMRRLYACAADAGVEVLLDGHGGDEVVSHGYAHLGSLARRGAYLMLARASLGAARVHGTPLVPLFLSHASQVGPASRWIDRANRAARRLGLRSAPDRTAWRRAVRPEAVERTNLVERYNAVFASRRMEGEDRRHHLEEISNDGFVSALEVMDRTAGGYGIEPRYPFLDRRLVEFGLSLPDSAKLRDGWTRAPLRDAMKELLPDAVRLRRDKSEFTPDFVRSLTVVGRDTLDRTLNGEADRIAPYADIDALRLMRTRLESGEGKPDVAEATALWRSVWLSLWLGQQEGAA